MYVCYHHPFNALISSSRLFWHACRYNNYPVAIWNFSGVWLIGTVSFNSVLNFYYFERHRTEPCAAHKLSHGQWRCYIETRVFLILCLLANLISPCECLADTHSNHNSVLFRKGRACGYCYILCGNSGTHTEHALPAVIVLESLIRSLCPPPIPVSSVSDWKESGDCPGHWHNISLESLGHRGHAWIWRWFQWNEAKCQWWW
jgi:hypothetical protein